MRIRMAGSTNVKYLRVSGLAALGIVTLCMAACGWRLQGSAKLSEKMASTYIETDDRYTDFNRALRDALRASGARLASSPRDATAVVTIIDDDSGEYVLAVSAANTPEEYEVFYTVKYSVSSGGEELISPQKIELTRDYSYDETATLAKQRESAILREALARDLAALVLRRLSAL
jgi:LPS-assembly lipoprotein